CCPRRTRGARSHGTGHGHSIPCAGCGSACALRCGGPSWPMRPGRSSAARPDPPPVVGRSARVLESRVRSPLPDPHLRTAPMDALDRYLEDHRAPFLENLKAALRIPSVSAQPQHKADVRRCAQHIADHLKQIGLTRVEVVDTPGHPVVYAEWLGAPGKPTAVLYGHHDEQPVDPVELR